MKRTTNNRFNLPTFQTSGTIGESPGKKLIKRVVDEFGLVSTIWQDNKGDYYRRQEGLVVDGQFQAMDNTNPDTEFQFLNDKGVSRFYSNEFKDLNFIPKDGDNATKDVLWAKGTTPKPFKSTAIKPDLTSLPKNDYIDKILNYELAQGGPGGSPLPLAAAFKFKSTGDPVKDRQIAREKVLELDAKYSEFGQYPGLKERMVDFAVNSEDPRAALLEAAGAITPKEKGQMYINTKLDTNKLDAYWKEFQNLEIDQIFSDPSFIQEFDKARDRSYQNTINADINYATTWGPRVRMFDSIQSSQPTVDQGFYLNPQTGQSILPVSQVNQNTQLGPVQTQSTQPTQNVPEDNELIDDGTFEEVTPEEVEKILANQSQQPTRQDFRKSEQAVYNDGRYNYVIGKDSQGNMVKQQVDPSGQIVPGGNVKVYRTNEELTQDLGRMRQLVPDNTNTQPSQSFPQIQNRRKGPKFLDDVKQFLNLGKVSSYGNNNVSKNNIGMSATRPDISNLTNMFADNNPHKGIYEDDRVTLNQGRQDLKDMRQQNIAERRETRAQRQSANVNDRLGKQADQNIFLKAKQQESGKTQKHKRLVKEIKNADKLEQKIANLSKKHNKIRQNIGQLEEQPKFMNDDILQQQATNQVGGFRMGGMLPKFQMSGTIGDWRTNTLNNIPGTDGYQSPEEKEQEQYDSYLPKPYGVSRGPYGNMLANNDNTQPKQSTSQTKDWEYDPYSLNRYGHRMQENALNRTNAYNLVQALDKPYSNQLYMPDFKMQRQIAQADFQPAVQQEAVAKRQIAQNQRSTAGMMGNLQQLAANMVKAKGDISRTAQQQQKQYDAKFMGEQQQYANQLSQAQQLRDEKNKQDQLGRDQFRDQAMQEWQKADIEKSKLYNTELNENNQLRTYVNQLSNEYKIVPDGNGQWNVVFLKNGKVDPNKTQTVNSLRMTSNNPRNANVTTTTTKTNRFGGMINEKRKKRRNGLY